MPQGASQNGACYESSPLLWSTGSRCPVYVCVT